MNTARYIAGRLGQGAFVLWAAFTATFVLLYLTPTDPVLIMLDGSGAGGGASEEELAALRAQYGFDQPVILQYAARLLAAAQGDFGTSLSNGQSALGSVVDALPATTHLAGLGLFLALAIAVGVALLATYVRLPWLRQALLAIPPLGLAIPTFWFGLILLQVFSFRLGWFPAMGVGGLRHLVLPALTLAVPVSAGMAQVMARSLRDVWESPFVSVASAKGATRGRVLVRHVLRNALPPVLAVFGLMVGGLLAGSVLTETIYSRPGVGRLAQQAVENQDIPVVQAIVVLAAVCYVLANLLADVAQHLLDPRVSVSRTVRA